MLKILANAPTNLLTCLRLDERRKQVPTNCHLNDVENVVFWNSIQH